MGGNNTRTPVAPQEGASPLAALGPLLTETVSNGCMAKGMTPKRESEGGIGSWRACTRDQLEHRTFDRALLGASQCDS